MLLIRPILLLLLLACALTTPAQETSQLTIELIDQRLSVLQASGGSSQEELRTAYATAIAQLNKAAAMEQEAKSFTEALATAPERAAAIQERLDRMDGSYDPAAELVGLNDEDMTLLLTTSRSERDDYGNRLEALDRRLAARETNANNANARLVEIDQRESELPQTALDISIVPTAAPSIAEATQWSHHAELLALNAERKALQAQLASQTVRFAALSAERVELATLFERRARLIRELEARLERTDANAPSLTEISIDALDTGYEIATSIIEQDTQLFAETTTLSSRLNDVRSLNDQITSLSRTVDDRYATARRIVDFAGDSDVLGRVLLTYWEEIENFSDAVASANVSGEAGGTVIRRIAHEDALAGMVSASGYVSAKLTEAGMTPADISASTMAELIRLTQVHRQRLRDTVAIESDLLQALSTLDSSDQALREQIREYRNYLEGLVLWIPNHPPLWQLSLASLPGELAYITETVRDVNFSLSGFSILYLLLAAYLWYRRHDLKTLQQERTRLITHAHSDSIRHTVISLASVLGRAAPVPLLFMAAAASAEDSPTSARTDLPLMMMAAALTVLNFHLLQIISEPGGIGRQHFKWRSTTMNRVYSEFTFLIRWWLPVVIIAALTLRLTRATGDEIIGRATLLVALIMIFYHTGTYQIRELRRIGQSWFREPLNRIRAALSVTFLVTIVAIVYGQVFSVSMIIWSLLQSMWLFVFLLLLYSVLMRWSRVARRHLRLNEVLTQRAESSAGEEKPDFEEELADLGDISNETQQLIVSGTVVAAVVGLIYIWQPLLPALEGLNRITLWSTTSQLDGETIINAVTLTTFIIALAVIAFTFFAARRIPALVEMVLRSRTSVSSGARYTTSTLLNYAIIGLGLIIGLSSLGLQWDKLQWLVAALGVGIGFGLQEIVANFISGLIILFERPIRVGDIITIGDKDGRVLKIRIRATTIRDWDGKELLVPNKEFITGRLLNWTLSDSNTRLVIPVGIAYGSDVEKALRLLNEVVNSDPRVLRDPPASFFFLGFGDNSLNLEARCFIANVDERLPTVSSLHEKINTAFNDAGIVIAFPQRDLHFDADRPLRISLDNPGSSSP